MIVSGPLVRPVVTRASVTADLDSLGTSVRQFHIQAVGWDLTVSTMLQELGDQ